MGKHVKTACSTQAAQYRTVPVLYGKRQLYKNLCVPIIFQSPSQKPEEANWGINNTN
jgi:hypothetical protein